MRERAKRIGRGLVVAALSAAACGVVCVLLPVWLVRKAVASKVASLWTGAPILTMALNARAERSLGYDARSLVTHTYYITDTFDYNLSAWRSLPLLGRLVPFAVFIWACLLMDRLHCYCDRGVLPPFRRFLFNPVELWAYRLLGKELFFWTYGADVRSRETTRALGEPNCCTDCTQIGFACVCSELLRARSVARLEHFATAIFAMGDMIEYTPGSRNDLFFWPLDLAEGNGEKYRPTPSRYDGTRPLRIVHAANHRMFKGTRFLEEAVRQLKAEGLAAELVIVEGVSNAQALELYRSADVIFDQCLIGFHGYFALEGMALGKPVMCYIRKPAQYLLHPEECPIINSNPATLKEDIRRLARDPARLATAGERGRRYIEKYFTVEAFAGRLDQAYRDLGVASCR